MSSGRGGLPLDPWPAIDVIYISTQQRHFINGRKLNSERRILESGREGDSLNIKIESTVIIFNAQFEYVTFELHISFVRCP